MYKTSQEKKCLSLFALPLVAITLFLSGCASQQLGDDQAVEVDPYEGFNRKIFGFNDDVDTYVAEPISDAYRWVAPQFVQTGVTNFFDNLKGINVVLNDFMQGKGQQGAEDTGRFLMNSTVGVLGLFDVATEVGLEQHDEDFAQTLAVWGVSQGPYWIVPFLGPVTSRGIPGGIFDAAANPATYVGAPVTVLQALNARANADNELNIVDEAALDPYVFTRESFLQYRNNLINDGVLDETGDLFDLDDEDFTDEEEPDGVENTDDKSISDLAVEPKKEMPIDKGEVVKLDASPEDSLGKVK